MIMLKRASQDNKRRQESSGMLCNRALWISNAITSWNNIALLPQISSLDPRNRILFTLQWNYYCKGRVMWSHGAAAVHPSDHVCRVRVSIPSRTQQEGPAQSCQPQQEANYCLLALCAWQGVWKRGAWLQRHRAKLSSSPLMHGDLIHMHTHGSHFNLEVPEVCRSQPRAASYSSSYHYALISSDCTLVQHLSWGEIRWFWFAFPQYSGYSPLDWNFKASMICKMSALITSS